jgi:hypothetical protein
VRAIAFFGQLFRDFGAAGSLALFWRVRANGSSPGRCGSMPR